MKALVLTPKVKGAEAARAIAEHPSDILYLTNPIHQLRSVGGAATAEIVTDDDLSRDNKKFSDLMDFSVNLGEGWFQQGGADGSLQYKGINLGEMVTRTVTKNLFNILLTLYLYDCLFKTKRVDEVVCMDDGGLWGKTLQFWAEKRGVRCRLVKQESGKAGAGTKNRGSLTRGLNRFLQFINRLSVTKLNRGGILFSSAPKYSMPILRQSRFNYFLRSEFSEKAFLQGKTNSFTHIIPDYFYSARQVSNHANFNLKRIFEDLDSFFESRPYFCYQDINFWPLLRDEMRRIVCREFETMVRLIDSFIGMIDRLAPRAVVVDEDINIFNKTLVACSNARGIKTCCLIHGVPFAKINAIPSISQSILAWGPSTKARLVSWGIAEAKIAETGAPQFEHMKRLDTARNKKEVFRDFLIPEGFRVVLLASSDVITHEVQTMKYPRMPLSQHIFEQSLRITLGFISKHPDLYLFIKLHPRYQPHWLVEKILDEFGTAVRSRVKVIQKYPSEKLVAASDLVLTTGSTVTYEAALLQRPAMVFDYSDNRFCSFISDDFLDLNSPESCWARLEGAMRPGTRELKPDPCHELQRHFSGSGLNAVRRVLNEIGNGS